MRKRAKIRIPTPPQMKNHGNWIISVSQLARWMGEQAEELGAFMLPETDAQKLIVDQGRVMGVVTGDKGRGRDGEELSAFEPGAEVHAKVTVIAEGTPGHLAGVVRSTFELDRDLHPELGARGEGGLGGRQAARQAHPHPRLAAALRRASTASTAARGSTRWARTRSRSAT